MRAAIYTRVSTDRQATEGVSLELQVVRCREAAVREGAVEIVEYQDAGESARDLDRPAVRRLLDDLPGFDLLVVWDQSRLTRSMRDLVDLVARLPELDVRVLSVTGGWIGADDPDGEMLTLIRGAVDQRQRKALIKNVRAALDHRAQAGLHHGKPAYGYMAVPGVAGEPMVPAPEEADVIRDVYRHYVRDRWAMRRIAAELMAAGVSTRHGGPWRLGTVRRILGNPMYMGMVPWRGELYEGRHEPLVTARVWREAQARMAANDRVPHAARRSLSPLFRCGACGGVVVCGGSRASGWYAYRCRARVDQPVEDRHDPVAVTIQKADALLWAYSGRLLGDRELLDRLMSQVEEALAAGAVDPERAAAEEELARLEVRMSRQLEAYEVGAITRAVLLDRNGPLVTRAEELRAQAVWRGGPTRPPTLPPADLRWLRDAAAGTVSRLAASSDVGRQREFLERIYDCVELHGDHIVFVHCLPLEPAAIAVPRYYRPRPDRAIPLDPWRMDT